MIDVILPKRERVRNTSQQVHRVNYLWTGRVNPQALLKTTMFSTRWLELCSKQCLPLHDNTPTLARPPISRNHGESGSTLWCLRAVSQTSHQGERDAYVLPSIDN